MTTKRTFDLVLGCVCAIIWLAVCIFISVWLYNWYSDTSIQASWIIHAALWLLLLEFLTGIFNAGMFAAGYEKKWIKKDYRGNN